MYKFISDNVKWIRPKYLIYMLTLTINGECWKGYINMGLIEIITDNVKWIWPNGECLG